MASETTSSYIGSVSDNFNGGYEIQDRILGYQPKLFLQDNTTLKYLTAQIVDASLTNGKGQSILREAVLNTIQRPEMTMAISQQLVSDPSIITAILPEVNIGYKIKNQISKILSVAKKIPELSILIILSVVAYLLMGLLSQVQGTAVLSSSDMWLLIVSSFLISTAIAVVAVIAGVGGGVLFTPIMLAFTSIDTLLIRTTGLVVAMFSGLISSGPFMRKGLSNIKIVLYCSIPIVIGAIGGSIAAISLAEYMGARGDAIVRLLLGLTLIFISIMFITGGANREYPKPKKTYSFDKKLGLQSSYWEESLQKVISYQPTKALPGGLSLILVGFTGGFFGLGGGWAVVPVLNLVMATPLKVSAACSGVLLAIGNSAAIWSYIRYGALISVLAAPWMLGQVIGGILGAHILSRIKASFVRNMLIGILFITSIKLVSRGIQTLFGTDIPIL